MEPPVPAPDDRPPVLEQGLRVLLAEDNQTNQFVVRATLEAYGCTVDIAVDGREAVEAVRDRDYDLVLMDLMMPELDGLQAARQIRNLPGKEPPVPIIAMSASASAEDRIACAQAGMDGFIAKPFVPSKMLSQISSVLSGGRIGGIFTPPPALPVDEVDRQVVSELFAAYGAMANGFIETFMIETGNRLQRMADQVAAKQPGDLVLDAHSLKGSALTFGCTRLSVLAGEIEHGAATDRDLPWSELLEGLDACFRRSATLLRRAAEAGAEAPGNRG
jgi:CheY-like chemotaxis protein/HPt (histidine-containing phosphotransfer) domain-containing protein